MERYVRPVKRVKKIDSRRERRQSNATRQWNTLNLMNTSTSVLLINRLVKILITCNQSRICLIFVKTSPFGEEGMWRMAVSFLLSLDRRGHVLLTDKFLPI